MDTIDSPMSRRTVLIGGAALGAAGAASVLTRGQRAAAQALIPGGPLKARVGGTFDLFPFAKGTTWTEALNEWNSTTGTKSRCWKVYFGKSKFPASIPPGSELKTIQSHGIQALVCFQPAIPDRDPQQAKSDRNKLRNTLNMFVKAGLDAQICLWQEVRPKDMKASEYKNLVKFYGPTVRKHYPLWFDAPGYLPSQDWLPYAPDPEDVNGYAMDLYCSDFIKHHRNLDPLVKLAGDSMPIGVWEIGNTDSDKFKPGPGDLKRYVNHLRSTLAPRAAHGLVGSVAYYNGPAKAGQGGGNEIVGTHRVSEASVTIAHYRTLYDAVNQVTS